MTILNNLLWHKKSDIFLSETWNKKSSLCAFGGVLCIHHCKRFVIIYTARRFSLLIHSCPISFHYSNVKDPTASYKRLLEFDRLNIMNFSTCYGLDLSIFSLLSKSCRFFKKVTLLWLVVSIGLFRFVSKETKSCDNSDLLW